MIDNDEYMGFNQHKMNQLLNNPSDKFNKY